MRTTVLVLLAAACGGSTNLPEKPRSWTEHVAVAREHEARAEEHARAAEIAENAPATFACTDPVLNDQLTSGTERVTTWAPCTDVQWQTEVRHRRAAERELEAAREEIDRANRLADTQRASCQGLSEAELESSPFADPDAISDVLPYRRGELRGARILLEPAPGQTVERLRRLIACHRARFQTLGQPATYLSLDPTVVATARVSVREVKGRIEVLVVTEDPGAALIIAGRARELTGPQTARR